MTYSAQLISLLKSRFPEKVSLNTITAHLNLSNSEALEVIDTLKEKGYPVQSISDHYQFSVPLINVNSIKSGLSTRTLGQNLIFKDRIHSTNALALEDLASFSHGDIILTDYQTNGKGRMGRSWQSSLGKSIAMSIILKPDIDNKKAVLLTQLTAAALTKSLNSIMESSIKWPNDIIVNNKKVAGILTESQFHGDSLEGIVIGVGINTNLIVDELDEEIQSKATSLFHEAQKVIDPNLLIQSFIRWFDELYTSWSLTGDSSLFISICKEKSIILNKEIIVRNGESNRLAQVIDINPFGDLIIRYKGEEALESLQSLDFSIRGNQSYI